MISREEVKELVSVIVKDEFTMKGEGYKCDYL